MSVWAPARDVGQRQHQGRLLAGTGRGFGPCVEANVMLPRSRRRNDSAHTTLRPRVVLAPAINRLSLGEVLTGCIGLARCEPMPESVLFLVQRVRAKIGRLVNARD